MLECKTLAQSERGETRDDGIWIESVGSACHCDASCHAAGAQYLFDFERARHRYSSGNSPILSSPYGRMRVQDNDWDNLTPVPVNMDNAFDELCQDARENHKDCFQWRYSEKEYHISTESFRLGTKRPPEGQRR